MGSGIIWGGIITGGWIASDYGPLNEIRNLSAAVTLIIIGGQVFFGGFCCQSYREIRPAIH